MNSNSGPDVVEQLPAGGNVSSPASGSYGAGAALDRLKASLPGVDATAPAVRETPPALGPPSGPAPSPGSTGLPAGLMSPTRQPDVPISTPLVAPPVNPVAQAADERQRRLLFLQQLAESQSVSDETREWADSVVRKLIAASAA